jgi:hypothetical protein
MCWGVEVESDCVESIQVRFLKHRQDLVLRRLDGSRLCSRLFVNDISVELSSVLHRLRSFPGSSRRVYQ